MLRPKRIYLAWFVLHFLLITAGSCRDTLWLIGHGLTVLGRPFNRYALQAEPVVATALAQNLPSFHGVRRTVATYLHLAGIERGYGYFAPNVPPAFSLVFELHHRDGRVEYQLPRVHSAAAGLRLTGLLDEIARTPSDRLREYLVKALARSIWQEQPEVITIRAVFGVVVPPGPNEFQRGEKESYHFLYAYDFTRADTTAAPDQP